MDLIPASFTLANPWALIFPIVLAAIALFRKTQLSTGALISSSTLIDGAPQSMRLRIRGPLLNILMFLFIASLTIVAARPRLISYYNLASERRNIVLSIDLSRSMGAVDFSHQSGWVSRLDAVKAVVSQFVQRRSEDRIGLVVFGARAFVQAPLTLDQTLLLDLIKGLEVGTAGDGTAIGDGIALALKRIAEIPSATSSVILVTDGVSNSGEIEPITAAGIARDMGIKIYTVAVGGKNDVINTGPAGMFIGRAQRAEVDEDTLQKIAKLSGGKHYNANETKDLLNIYVEIDRLEQIRQDEPPKELVAELYYPFLALSLIAYLFYALLSDSWLLRLP